MDTTARLTSALPETHQYVSPTPAFARELCERMLRYFPGSSCRYIPAPARVLGMLRALANGNRLLASGKGTSLYLENFPDAIFYAQLFFSCGWLEPVMVHVSGSGTAWWGLSERGQRKLEEGLDWWHGLSRRERFWRSVADGTLLA